MNRNLNQINLDKVLLNVYINKMDKIVDIDIFKVGMGI